MARTSTTDLTSAEVTVVQSLEPIGSALQQIRVNAGATSLEYFTAGGGTGDVSKVGTPVNNQVGVWTGDGTLEGDTALTFDTTTDTLTSGIFNGTALTASQLTATDASKNIVSLAVATYPSLTEISYVKGVTSAIQTQINTKAPTASPTFTGTVSGITAAMVGAPSGSGSSSGTNTGDQTIANTSDATSHTVTLSASGGSVKLAEGSGITLTTTGTSADGIVTIASTGGGSGDVVGPASATDNGIARFDTTTGKLIQNSAYTLSDTGVIGTVMIDLAADPTVTNDGRIAFNTTNKELVYGNGTVTKTVVSLDNTQTLTNKTLTSPTLTTPVLGTPTSGTLTNCTFPTLNQNTTGYAEALKSATTTVSVSAATAPTSGQVLTATSGTTATWQTPSGGSFSWGASVSAGSGVGLTMTSADLSGANAFQSSTHTASGTLTACTTTQNTYSTSRTYTLTSGSVTDNFIGSLFSRTNVTTGAGGTLLAQGPVVNITGTDTQTAGTLTPSYDLLKLQPSLRSTGSSINVTVADSVVTAPTNGHIYAVLGNTQTVAQTLLKLNTGSSATSHIALNIETTRGTGIRINSTNTVQATASNSYGIHVGATFNTNSSFTSFGIYAVNKANSGSGSNGGIRIYNEAAAADVNVVTGNGIGLSIAQIGVNGNAIAVYGDDNTNCATTGLVNYTITNTQSGATVMQKIDLGSSAQAHNGLLVTGTNGSTTAALIKLSSGSGFTGAPLAFDQDNVTSTNYRKLFTELNTGISLWMGNGTDPNGVLSGTAGDMLINGATNKPAYCTGTTVWVNLV